MKMTLGNQAHPDLNHPKIPSLQNEELAPPGKSLGFRFCTYLVLWSFFFQTIWPSVAFAEALIRETTPIHHGIKRHSLSLGVHIDDKYLDEVLGSQRTKSSSRPKGRRIQVEFDDGLANLQAEIQKSLDIQSFYPDLQATVRGLTWTSFGRSFLMTYEGNLVVSRDTGLEEAEAQQEYAKKPFLDLLNPHGDITLGPDLQVDHVQARAKDVYMAGSSVIPHLEIWAQGGSILTNPDARTAAKGLFKVPLEATLTTKLLTIHQGKTEIDGTVSLIKDGILDANGNELSKTGTLIVETGVTVRNVPDFQNEGPIKGKSLTLEDTVFTNGARIDLDHLATLGGKFYNNSKVFLKAWDQEGGTFSNAMGSTFQVQGQSTFEEADIKNGGVLSLLGDTRGSIQKFVNSSALTMGSVSWLRATTFFNTGNFEVTGPMNWSGTTFKTTNSTILRGKSQLTVGLLETNGIFSALDDFTLQGTWHHLGGVATLSKASRFDAQTILNKGTLNLLGESRGTIGTLTNEGSLIMGIVSGLRVRDFSSPGTFEVTGPMTWLGEKFKAAKTTFRGKTSITSAVIETEDDLTAESDLSLLGNWTHKKGKARIAGLLLKGKSFKTEQGATVTVTGSADVQTNTAENEGSITFEGSLKGRIDDFINRGNVIVQGDAHLTGKSILNSNTFKALGIFDWVGETLTNTTTGKMSLFDNRVMATRQVINQGLLLWTHNTFRTWHFLNMGWAEMTRNLDAVMPDTWRVPRDTSTTFKKSTVENRGTLKITPKNYTPRMTLEHSGDFAHWSNKGKMQLPDTHLQAQSFKNEGDLAVDGALTGTVEAFENTSKAVLQGPVHLTGKTFTSTGTMVLANKSTLKVDSLTTGGTFTAQSELTLEDGVDWTNLEGSETDITRLLFKGKSIGNDGNLLIRELMGSPSTKRISFLRNGHINSPKGEKTRPVFKILKGGTSLTKVVNHGVVALVEGRYLLRDVTNPGILEVDTLLPEGTDPFVLNGTIHAKSFCTSAFRGTKIINTGKTTFDSTSFRTQIFENKYGAILTLFGYGTADIGTLDNGGVIVLNNMADINVDTLENKNGTIESSTDSLRLLLLDSYQSAQSERGHPTVTVRKGTASNIYTGKLKAKKDLIIEIAASFNVAAYLSLSGDGWQCGGILRLYGDTFWARWDKTYTGAAHIKVNHFQNPNRHLIFRSLKVEADDFYNGLSNEEMGTIETMPDRNKPDADTSLEIISKKDLDNRHGKMFGHGETTLRSIEGDVLSGESVEETKYSGVVPYPYYNPNGSFIASNKDITIDGRNVFLKLSQVNSTEGHLYLVAENNVRSLASDVYAKLGVTINGVRFDNEVFATDWIYSPQTTNSTPGNEHLKYVSQCIPQRSRPASVRSLGNIRMNTQITRSYGSHILASKRLIDKKGKSWKGKTTSESRQKDMCPFISYESQALPSGWTETNTSPWDRWSRWNACPTGCVLSVVEAGEGVKAEAPYFENGGWMSSPTMELTAVEAMFRYMGAAGQQAIQTLMDLGILSVRHFVEPEVTKDGFMTKQSNGTVRQKGTRSESKRSTPLSDLPIIGKHPGGVPDHTKMYVQIHVEVEKLQQMMAFTLGRLYDQGFVGEDVYDAYLREGQRQFGEGALVDIRQNKSNKPFIAYLLEKVRDAETNEEVLLAVMNLFVPEALRVQLRSGEARSQEQMNIQTDGDLGLKGGKVQCDKGPVKLKVGGDLNATPVIETYGGGDQYTQSAVPPTINAPENSVEAEIGGAFNAQGVKVLAETSIDINADSFRAAATRLEDHFVTQNGGKKTTTHKTHHDVSEFITTGVESTVHLTSRSTPFYGEALRVLTGPRGKTWIAGPGIAIVDIHDEDRTESIERQSSGGPFGGSTTIRDVEHSVRSRGAVFNNILELVDTTGRTGITLVGADCSRVTKAIFDCPEGLLALRAGINAYMRFHSEEDKSAVWQSYQHDMSSSKTYTPCQFSPECEFEINSIVPVLVEQTKGQTLAWIEPLYESLKRNGGSLNLQELEEIYKHEQFEQAGPTAAASLVVALAITICTAGAMAHAGAVVATSAGLTTAATATTAATLTAAGTVVQVMTAATLTSLTVSAANCVLNNLNDPSKALKDFMKSDTWKAAGKAAVAAAVLKVAANTLGAPGSAMEASQRSTAEALKMAEAAKLAEPTLLQSLSSSVPHYATFHALNMATNIGVDVAWGQNLERAFGSGAIGFGAGLLGALGSHQIGAAYAKETFDVFTHKLLHAGVGAASGAIMGGTKGATAGAMGAFVAETFADVLSTDKPMQKVSALEAEKGCPLTAEEFTHHYEEELAAYKPKVEHIENWARIVAASTALLAGQDVSAASMAATNAVQNNFLLVAFYGVVAANLAYSSYKVYNAYEEGGVQAALGQLGIEVVINVGGAVAGRAVGLVVYKVGGMAYPTVAAALTAVLDSTPGLRFALGKMVDRLTVAGEAIGRSALGRGVARAEVALGKMEAKVGDKLGLKAGAVGREIILTDGFYQAEKSAFKFSEYYYKKLWDTGRGAPFLQAEEVFKTAKTILPDRMPGFNRYVNDTFEMIYNPTTKEVWHLQPLGR
jgi:hypothetical protein